MTSILWMGSPVGSLALCADAGALTGVSFADGQPPDTGHDGGSLILVEARRQLAAYFRGERREFDLPVAARGTDFQRAVWAELRAIPFGATTSYGEIARRLGLSPGASRAVGLANGANPVAIVIPCHRVIGANGKLIGFAGGLDRKRFLLRLESGSASQGVLLR